MRFFNLGIIAVLFLLNLSLNAMKCDSEAVKIYCVRDPYAAIVMYPKGSNILSYFSGAENIYSEVWMNKLRRELLFTVYERNYGRKLLSSFTLKFICGQSPYLELRGSESEQKMPVQSGGHVTIKFDERGSARFIRNDEL